jgi:RNA polymerase sigma factor (sigma-70 family)
MSSIRSTPVPDYASLSDSELVELSRDDDARAFAELWIRHRPAALAAARRTTRRFDAEDLVAESFARVLHAIVGGGGPRTAFRAYLTATIRNVAINWAKAQPTAVSLDVVQELSHGKDHTRTIEDRDAMSRALARLPERWKTALWLSEVEGLTRTQMATELGISKAAVAMLNHRARRGLLGAISETTPTTPDGSRK